MVSAPATTQGEGFLPSSKYPLTPIQSEFRRLAFARYLQTNDLRTAIARLENYDEIGHLTEDLYRQVRNDIRLQKQEPACTHLESQEATG